MISQSCEGKMILFIFLCWLITPGFVYTQDSSQNLHRLYQNTIEMTQKNPSFQKFITSLHQNGRSNDSAKVDSLQPEFDSAQVQRSNFVPSNPVETASQAPPKVPPRIIHIPVTNQNLNHEFLIIAQILDDKPQIHISLNYRKGEDSRFIQEPMLRLNSFYQAKIPANMVTPSGIEYFIKATDSDSLSSRLPVQNTFFIAVHIPAASLNCQVRKIQPDSLSKWQLFSVPMKLEQNEVKGIFALQGRLDNDNSYHQIQPNRLLKPVENIEQLVPGDAFWTIASDTQKVLSSGKAVSIPTNTEFLITLQPGWNFIGNPFTFPIAIDQLYRKSEKPFELRTFQGRWNQPLLEPIAVFKPFEGYAIYNHLTFQDSLLIRPRRSDEAFSRQKYQVQPEHSFLWMIQINANASTSQDIDNCIGQSNDAAVEWDPYDAPEPPAIGENVALFFNRPDWKKTNLQFCTDFRPAVEDGDVWDFQLNLPALEDVTLNFKGIHGLPGKFDVWLVDDGFNLSRDLRLFPEYLVTAVDTPATRTFRLIIGKKDFIDEKLTETITIPGNFQLAQNYPNPFNLETNIQYSLAAAGEVTLKIFNLVGEEVSTLVDKQNQTAGYYLVTWNGEDDLRHKMTSGIYVYQLWVNNFTLTRKMVLMK